MSATLPRAAALRHDGHVPLWSSLPLAASYLAQQDFAPLSQAALSNGLPLNSTSNGFCLNARSACLTWHLRRQAASFARSRATASSHFAVFLSGGTNPEATWIGVDSGVGDATSVAVAMGVAVTTGVAVMIPPV